MNARTSNNHNVTRAILSGALLAVLSFNAVAESTFSVDARPPLAATLLPSVKVTASISNPSDDARWNVSPKRALRVTLMPTVTVTADIYALTITTLPTVTVTAPAEIPPTRRSQSLVLAPAFEPPMLDMAD